MKMNIQNLEGSFEQALGIAGARALVRKALREANIHDQRHEFTRDEVITICEALKKEGGFIATTADILLARCKLSDWKRAADKIVLKN